MQKYLDKFPKKQKYDGNDLESACDAYGYAFTNWGEVVRYEQAIEECTKALPEIIEMVRREEREFAIAIINKYEAMPFSPTTFSRIKSALTPLPEDNK